MRKNAAQVPFFTVLICTYQRARILPRAIRSVLDQTDQDFEIIVVDDGSAQDIEGVVESFGDERIRLFELEENQGVARATNLGFQKAVGQYICFLDDDDEFLPTFLEDTRRHLEETEVDFCWCGILEYLEGGTTREQVIAISETELYHRQKIAALIGSGFGFTFRRSCLENVPLYDEALESCTDLDFFLNLVQQPWRWSCLPSVLVKVYRQPQRLTLLDERYARSLDYIVKKHRAFLSHHWWLNSNLHFQLGTILADSGERTWARTCLWPYLKINPLDWRLAMLFLSNELRHSSIGLRLLKVYRFFYHRFGGRL